MTEAPTWFGPAARPLAGWVHWPHDGQSRGAVVLCPPLGRQYLNAHSTFRLLAEELAARGLTAVRFDYDGTGDSAGADQDPGRVAAWVHSIHHAVGLARRSGAPTVSLVGMRIGAVLAAEAAREIDDLESLVLWDPYPSGRAFVREQRALWRLRFPGADDQGGVGLPGWWLRLDTDADLRSLGTAGPGVQPGPRHALVLTRPGTAAPRRLVEAVGAGAISYAEAKGQPELLEVETLDFAVPTASLAEVASFLDRTHSQRTAAVRLRCKTEATVGQGAGAITERMVALGDDGLFAVVASPAAAVDPQIPKAMLVNCGMDLHVGSGRIWVELARRWAAAGIEAVRLDVGGLGDSHQAPGQERFVIRSPRAFSEVANAAAAISPSDPSNVVLVGLCAGGYQALDSAFDLQPAGVCAINPLLRFAPPEMATGRIDPRRRLCRPPHPVARSSKRLPAGLAHRSAWWALWRLTHLPRPSGARGRWVRQLTDKGVDVLVVCGDQEAAAVGEGTKRWLADPECARRFTLATIPGLDHAVVPSGDRQMVADLLYHHVLDRFGPPRGPSGAAGPHKGVAGHEEGSWVLA